MKKKSAQVVGFLEGLHDYITTHPQFRQDTSKKSEVAIQTEIRPLIINYLERHFENTGKYKDYVAKANKSFYWEGQEGIYGRERESTFASKNYPDFIITEPYLIAIEYKQSKTGALIKQAVGQSLMHTMCNEFDYVYVIFNDQNKDKRIVKSLENQREQDIINSVWNEFNVFLRIV